MFGDAFRACLDRSEIWLSRCPSEDMGANVRSEDVHTAALAQVCRTIASRFGSRSRTGVDLPGPPDAHAVRWILGLSTHSTQSLTFPLNDRGLADLISSDVRSAIKRTEVETGHGTRLAGSAPIAASLFRGHALAACRRFELIWAMRFARAGLHLGEPEDVFAATLARFILHAQNDDGSFLLPDDVMPAHRTDRDAHARVACAAAVQCLWTLAEIEDPAFRLAEALGIPGVDRVAHPHGSTSEQSTLEV